MHKIILTVAFPESDISHEWVVRKAKELYNVVWDSCYEECHKNNGHGTTEFHIGVEAEKDGKTQKI